MKCVHTNLTTHKLKYAISCFRMMDSLKDRIATATEHVESFTNVSNEEEFDDILKHKKSGGMGGKKQSHGGAESKSAPSAKSSKATKYAVGTMAGAAGGAVAAAVIGK
jgi:hypothetical protein